MNYKNKLLTRAKGPGRELSAYILAVNMWLEAFKPNLGGANC